MDLTYEKCGDYLIPNLIPDPEPEEPLTKYGLMRRNYLKEHRRGVFSGMLMMGELKTHCLEVQRRTEERMDFLTEQMAKTEGVDEALKASDQMKWVRRMNNIRARAEEIVLIEIVYN